MKTPICSDPSQNKVYSFVMKDGTTFKADGFNVQEAFETHYSMDKWGDMEDWEYLDGEKPEVPAVSDDEAEEFEVVAAHGREGDCLEDVPEEEEFIVG